MGVRGQPGPSAPQIPVPPAVAAGCFPDLRASDGVKRTPSDSAPPTAAEADRETLVLAFTHAASWDFDMRTAE